MFPEDCTTNCEGGTAIDFMLKKGRPKCPDTINHGKEQDDFIGSTLDMCNAKVRYLNLHRIHWNQKRLAPLLNTIEMRSL